MSAGLATLDAPRAESLPALLMRASGRLAEARDSAEVLEAKKIAEAALHYAKVTKAANETHADCLRIITRAEMRMADEIDRGQERGEVALAHRPKTVQASDTSSASVPDEDSRQPATFDDLGIDRRRVSEWREIRDAGPEVVEQAIEGALAEGRPPTKADIKAHVRGTFGTGDNQWFTPAEYLDKARAVLGEIDLDPATHEIAQERVGAARYFTESDNGLQQEWLGNVWLNPPYAQPAISHFVDKLVDEAGKGVEQAIMLTHNYTDTAWFQKAARAASAICFTRGRVRFESPDGELAAPTQGQAFFYFGHAVDRFVEVFSSVGFVVEVRG